MKQEQGTEKMDVVNDNSIAVNKPLTSDDVRQIRRTRLILLILIGICFVSFQFFLNDDRKYLMKQFFFCLKSIPI
jgi:uncharacterized YccA/Bax inhibitor family protein